MRSPIDQAKIIRLAMALHIAAKLEIKAAELYRGTPQKAHPQWSQREKRYYDRCQITMRAERRLTTAVRTGR